EPVRRWCLHRTAGGAGTVVDAACPATLPHPCVVRCGEIVTAIGSDRDGIDAGDVDRPGHHAAPGFDRLAEIVAGDVAVCCASDDAARLPESLEHVVRFVALVIEQGTRVGVRHGDGLVGYLDC